MWAPHISYLVSSLLFAEIVSDKPSAMPQRELVLLPGMEQLPQPEAICSTLGDRLLSAVYQTWVQHQS